MKLTTISSGNLNPFQHVLIFGYKGNMWKAIFRADKTAIMLRKANSTDFDIVWSTIRGKPGELAQQVFRQAAEIMTHWRWPRRLDLTTLGENDA
jgi:hypothetical protein